MTSKDFLDQFNFAKRSYLDSVPPVKVLDKGHVKLADFLGDDLAVANAARASFEKESFDLSAGDEKLIAFLAREDHMSPFRHEVVKFNLRAPLMVARQHWKYVVGSDHTMDGWNEASRRYVAENEEFYIPLEDQWRSAPDNKKQGSGGILPQIVGENLFNMLIEDTERQLDRYKQAMAMGACAEQARLFLPAYGLYVSYVWTASLQSLVHFLKQRLAHDAQKEIQEYAAAVYELTKPLFPVTFEVFGL